MDTVVEGAFDEVGVNMPLYPGRNDISDRVILKVVEQASATALGVPRATVSASVSGATDGLAVTIASPLPIPSLDDSAAVRAASPALDRVGEIQTGLLGELARLTGRPVRRLNITINGALMRTERRVR
jgi:hypothetical protein